MYNYLDSLNVDVETRCEMGLYLDLVGSRANGESLPFPSFHVSWCYSASLVILLTDIGML